MDITHADVVNVEGEKMEIQERGVFDASKRGGTPSQPVVGSSVSFLSMWAPQEERQKDVCDCVCVCVCWEVET